MGPFVKWVGGKTQLLPQLVRFIPRKFDRYIEPMLGGGALFWKLASMGLLEGKQVLLADVHAPLMEAYRAVRETPGQVATDLGGLERLYLRDPETVYYYQRDLWNSGRHTAARFIFLKQTSFNGLWRTNSRGELNMPWGHYQKPRLYDLNALAQCSKTLQGIDLRCCSYRDLLPELGREGDFIYFDPPYLGTFGAYSALPFKASEHETLIQDCAELTRQGAYVLYSHQANPTIRAWLETYWERAKVVEVTARRFINRDGQGRKPVAELLVHSSRYTQLEMFRHAG